MQPEGDKGLLSLDGSMGGRALYLLHGVDLPNHEGIGANGRLKGRSDMILRLLITSLWMVSFRLIYTSISISGCWCTAPLCKGQGPVNFRSYFLHGRYAHLSLLDTGR